MKNKILQFEEAIRDLEKFDPHSAHCILACMEGMEEAIGRELTENEKMITYSAFLSGTIAERFNPEKLMMYTKICLN
jgi:hypothetical protein